MLSFAGKNVFAAMAAGMLICAASAAPALAAGLASENFSYPDGALTTVSGGKWSAHSGAGSVPVQVSAGAAVLSQGSGSREDVSTALSDTLSAGETFHAGFDATITGGSNLVYFAHFRDDGTGFNGRIFVAPPTNGGDFTFGISDVSGTAPDATIAAPFTFGTLYRPVVSYNFDTGLSTLTVNGLSVSSTTVDAGEDIQTFAFRQAGGNSTQIVDNLIVATTFEEAAVPEPSSLGLAAVGGLLMLRRRRA